MNLKAIVVNIPEADVEALDSLVDAKFFPNRNEAIRAAIRDLVRVHKDMKKET